MKDTGNECSYWRKKGVWNDDRVLYWSPSVRSMVHILPLNHRCFLLTPWCLDFHTRPANWAVGLIFCESLTKHCTGWVLASVFLQLCWLQSDEKSRYQFKWRKFSRNMPCVYIMSLKVYLHARKALCSSQKTKLDCFSVRYEVLKSGKLFLRS